MGLTWDAVRGRWLVEPGGDPVVPAGGGDPVGAATVLVQKVTTRPSAIRDAAGAVSPYAVTTGEGEAEVLRDGRAFPARWSRPTPTDPTRVLDAGGAPGAVRARTAVGPADARGRLTAPSGGVHRRHGC